jgi:hypothetical protein
VPIARKFNGSGLRSLAESTSFVFLSPLIRARTSSIFISDTQCSESTRLSDELTGLIVEGANDDSTYTRYSNERHHGKTDQPPMLN